MYQVGDVIRIERVSRLIGVANYWYQRNWKIIEIHTEVRNPSMKLQGFRKDGKSLTKQKHMVSMKFMNNYMKVTKVN